MTSFSDIVMRDIDSPQLVQIEYDEPRGVLYINIDGITVLRVSRIQPSVYHYTLVNPPQGRGRPSLK